ncbi:MAG: DUF2304 domain-containing protein [Actinomycetota bacterium]|jgi:hypothetical protein|nr:DUF2304 domain-containing protein [Actinomycetota bacterium]
MSKLEVFVVVIALLNVAAVVEFVRRRKLSENFALLWITVGLGGVVLSVARPLFDAVARAVGVSYGPSLLFSLALIFLLFVCMSLSLHVSRLEARTEILAEEVAFLRSGSTPADRG